MKITEIRNHAWCAALRQAPKDLALLLAMGLGLFNGAWADTSVWVITSGNNTVYLGGTVHLLRPTDYPLPEEYEQAYQASSEIYFETDISAMTDFSVQAQMLQQLSYDGDRTLKTVLNTEAYTALSAYADKLGLPLMMLEKFKPGMVVAPYSYWNFRKWVSHHRVWIIISIRKP